MADEPAADETEIETTAEVTAADVALVAGEAADVLRRAWLDAILPISKYTLPADQQFDPSVQSAVDSLLVTVCARLKRIMRSDLK